MMTAQPKPTKKQRKALAFKQRKGKPIEEPNDLPEIDVVENDDDELEPSEPTPIPDSTPSGKRKRDTTDDVAPQPVSKKSKKVKSTVNSSADAEAGEESNATTQPSSDPKKDNRKQRFILFVGNLSYKTTIESIQAHFASCPSPPSIRLLTPKPSAPSVASSKSKGCAFLEFPDGASLQHALHLHHTSLDGRTINVELTSGGGGSGDKRRESLKTRNKALESQRDKFKAKVKSKQKPDANADGDPNSATRHSTTSGTDPSAIPASKAKTWSVPQHDGEKAGRGGVKHRRDGGRGGRGGRTPRSGSAKRRERAAYTGRGDSGGMGGGGGGGGRAWRPSGANAVALG